MPNEPWTTNATNLRQAAEHADGYREQTLYLFYREQRLDPIQYPDDDRVGVVVHVNPADAQAVGDHPLHVNVFTGYTNGSTMGMPEKVEVHYKDFAPTDLIPCEFDSLFWTQSAVEKFLIPYYASIYSAEELDVLRQLSQDPSVLAIGHRYPTIYEDNPHCDSIHAGQKNASNVLYVIKTDGGEAPETSGASDSRAMARTSGTRKRLTVETFGEVVKRRVNPAP